MLLSCCAIVSSSCLFVVVCCCCGRRERGKQRGEGRGGDPRCPRRTKPTARIALLRAGKREREKEQEKGKGEKDRMVFVSLISGFYGPRELQGFRVLIFTGRVAPGTSLLALPSCYFLLSAVHTAVLVSRSGVLSCCPSRPENLWPTG